MQNLEARMTSNDIEHAKLPRDDPLISAPPSRKQSRASGAKGLTPGGLDVSGDTELIELEMMGLNVDLYDGNHDVMDSDDIDMEHVNDKFQVVDDDD